MMKKTKKEMYQEVIAQLTNPEHIAFIEHEIELLNKRNANKVKKATAIQKANAILKDNIVEYMGREPERTYTVGELAAAAPGLEGASTQKVSALLKQLVDAGKVVKTYEQRKAFYSLAGEEEIL